MYKSEDAQATQPVTPRVERFTSSWRRAAVAHCCGPSRAAPDRLIRAFPPRCWLVLAPGPADHTPPSRPSSCSLVPLSTACTSGHSWTTPEGPDSGSVTKTVPAPLPPLALSMAPHKPLGLRHGAYGG